MVRNRALAQDITHPLSLLLCAWMLLTLATTADHGFYGPGAVLALAASLSVFTVFLGVRSNREADISPSVAPLAAATTALAVAYRFDVYGLGRAIDQTHYALLLGALLTLAIAMVPAAYRRTLALLGLLTGAFVTTRIIAASPSPGIDVWRILTDGSVRMFSGHNIYTACWPHNFDPRTKCIYPYLPMTTVSETPFRWTFGDIRYAHAAAIVGAAAVLWAIGGRRWGPFLAALLLVTPLQSFLVQEAWTEPLLFVAVAAMVLATLRGRPALAVLAFALALASKQHMLLLIPSAAVWPAFGRRRTVASIALASAFVLPWFVANPSAFLHDALWFNLRLKPRPDSLSVFTTATRIGWTPPFLLVGALSLAAIAVAVLVLPRSATGFVAGSALVLFVFNLVNKQSFFNEWWLVGALLLLTVATYAGEAEPAHREPASARAPS